MSTTAAPPIRFNRAVPQFTVLDLRRTAEYWRDVLGFTIDAYWGKPPVFAIVHRDDVSVYFSGSDDAPQATGRAEDAYDVYFHIEGVDQLAVDLRRRGAEILDGPEDRVYGRRELVIKDCNGLVLTFGEPAPNDEERMAEMLSR
jgi:catechol 2,3-dioxygenase-like lactoylglutathione lyase family enzyme